MGLLMLRTSIAASAQDITTLTLTSAVGGTLPWTFGQGFAQGDIPSGSYIASPIQADVRNRWPDGSVRYAVLSGLSAAGAITIARTASAPGGSNVAEPSAVFLGSNASVTFTGAVTGTYTPSTARTNGITAWDRTTARKVREILGPVMSEFHYYSPTDVSHVTVWWYVRAYADSSIEVETVVENGWFLVATPAAKTYTVTVAIGGSTVYGPTELVHFHRTRWSRVDWIGTDPAITPAHDAAYLRSTKLVPNYAYNSPTSGAFTGFATAINPAPFALGNWKADMAATGDVDPIGVMPRWEALYCSSADSRAYAATISNNRGHGRWSVHYRDETTGRPLNHASYPTYTMVSGWGASEPPAGGAENDPWDIPHHPSVGYLAYLIEGRWSQLESSQFVAAFSILDGNPTFRNALTGHGIIACINAFMTTRGAAWTWRSAGQAAAISPEYLADSAVSGEDAALGDSLRTSIENTVTWLNARYITGSTYSGIHANTVGWLGQYDPYGSPDGDAAHWWGAGFMVQFQIAALAHLSDLGIADVTQATLQAVRDHAYEGLVRLTGDDATWNFRRAATYAMPFLSNTDPNTPTFYTTAQAFDAYLAFHGISALSANLGDSLKDHASDTDMANDSSSEDVSGYWAPVIANLSSAAEHGKTGAAAGLALVIAASNYDPVGHGVHDDPKWGWRPR